MPDRPKHPGDSGESALLDGSTRHKDDPVFEALGAVDELAASLGVLRAELTRVGAASDARAVQEIQRALVTLGGMIATPAAGEGLVAGIAERDVEALDGLERALEQRAPRPRGFVVPGASAAEALAHVARTSCRAAERRLVGCIRAGSSHLAPGQRYLNHLASCLFWLALCYGLDE
jgi:cob(I)alamin adenosyltransferase